MEYDEFVSAFSIIIDKTYRDFDQRANIFLLLYENLYRANGKLGLCFGCGEIVSVSGLSSLKYFQLRGKWHCVSVNTVPEPLIITNKNLLEQFIEPIDELLSEEETKETEDADDRMKGMADNIQTTDTIEVVAAGTGARHLPRQFGIKGAGLVVPTIVVKEEEKTDEEKVKEAVDELKGNAHIIAEE